MKTLKYISNLPADEFWKKYDAGELPEHVIRQKKHIQSLEAETTSIVNLVLTDWLTNSNRSDMALSYVLYGEQDDKVLKAVLIDIIHLPKKYLPSISGLPFQLINGSERYPKENELAIRFDKIEKTGNGRVAVEFTNYGRRVVGGLTVSYEAYKTNNVWAVRFREADDP